MRRPVGPFARPSTRVLASVIGLLASFPQAAAAQGTKSPGAGGAALDQIAIATGGAVILTAILLWLGLGHRSGKVGILQRIADYTTKRSGLPGWAALPATVAAISLIIAVFGMYWDIALHIDRGRDEGPLANPAHYFILFGLFGIFSAGWVAMVLPKRRPSASAIRIGKGWYAPLGGVLICACGAFALIGFPLDDIWHRIFGQDVTLWGPTHLMLIGGASMTLIGIAVLAIEGVRSNAVDEASPRELASTRILRGVALTGGLMLGLSTFQAEFDFGVPQFRFVFGPVLVMLAAGVGLVAVRVWGGRGAAIGAVLFFLALRGILALLVGPILGETTPVAPLYVVEALVVEVVALRVATTRPLAFGLWSGLGIVTLGLASEWAWTHLVYPIPFPSTLVGEGVPYGVVAGLSGAVVGAWIGARLQEVPHPADPPLRWAAVLGAVGIAVVFGTGLLKPADRDISAQVALQDVPVAADAPGAGRRNVQATVRLDPPNAADDAKWLTATAWQDGGFIVDRLRRVSEGVYRTTQPIPVSGTWKAMIRLHVGRGLYAVPIYLPEDDAIGAPQIAAPRAFERTFITDHKILQREQKPAAATITLIAYLVVALIAFGLLVLLVWGLHRLSVAGGRDDAPSRRSRAEEQARTKPDSTPAASAFDPPQHPA